MDLALDDLLAWKGAFVAAWFGLFFLAERLRPAASEPLSAETGRPQGWRRVARNLGLFGGNLLLHPLLVLPVSILAVEHQIDWRPAWWAGPWGLLADLLLLDFLIYWWHRANHELPFLWRFHEVHHLDGFLDSSSAIRFHFGEVALSACARALVIVLLDIPLASVLVFETVVLMAAIFHHSNFRLPESLERYLSRVVVTPSIHWVHHHALRRDTDSNYGNLFSFWDRLFRSRSATPRGLAMRIGVEGRREQPFLALLIRPFKLFPRRPESRRPA